MNTNYLIIIIFLLIVFNKNNIEKFTVERCRNGMKENGEKCDCDEFNKRCPTKEEALAFILKKNKAGKNGKNLFFYDVANASLRVGKPHNDEDELYRGIYSYAFGGDYIDYGN